MTLTAQRARELLDYDPATGVITRKLRHRNEFKTNWSCAAWNTMYGGKQIVGTDSDGYLRFSIDNRTYRAHRVAWLLFHGYWPGEVDHEDGCRTNNRIANLRDVTVSENNRNRKIPSSNTSGCIGVYRVGRFWKAKIFSGGKFHHLGSFESVADAALARKAAERQLGFHENHGRAA